MVPIRIIIVKKIIKMDDYNGKPYEMDGL